VVVVIFYKVKQNQ